MAPADASGRGRVRHQACPRSPAVTSPRPLPGLGPPHPPEPDPVDEAPRRRSRPRTRRRPGRARTTTVLARTASMRRGILERREVAGILADAPRPARRGARSWRCASSAAPREAHLGRARRPCPAPRRSARAGGVRSSSAGSLPGAQHAEAPHDLALDARRGTPTAQASATAGSPTSADSYSAGPMRLPATLSVSSERPCRNQSPSSSTEAQSPCVQTPWKRRQ